MKTAPHRDPVLLPVGEMQRVFDYSGRVEVHCNSAAPSPDVPSVDISQRQRLPNLGTRLKNSLKLPSSDDYCPRHPTISYNQPAA
ncbi:hypothetical protein H4Q26_007348 [Puccinia striiformis f. sp. tritici PST-130]|nr:hypothetical protein H4Q26_007348 [Puccinia striiformis f. sp. tritici PST-130]